MPSENTMASFRNIDELIRTLDREKILLLSLLDYKLERLKFLVDSGVILSNGDFLELEEVYLKFFEDVLQVNEQIDVASVAQIISALKDTIEYYIRMNFITNSAAGQASLYRMTLNSVSKPVQENVTTHKSSGIRT